MATAATMASAATNAMTQRMNTFLATHFNELNAATTAMMAHNSARGLVGMAWDDLKQIFSIFKPVFGSGNTVTEYWTSRMNIVAFAEAARLIEIAYLTKTNREMTSNILVKAARNVKRAWDPIRVHTIRMTVPYQTKCARLISTEAVSIPYTFHQEDGTKSQRYLWFYPFIQMGELVKIEVWTDRKWMIDFVRGYSAETLEHAKNYLLYMLIPTNVTTVSILESGSPVYIWTRVAKFVQAIAEQNKVTSGTMVNWMHGGELIVEVMPACMVVIYRDPVHPHRAVYSVPIGSPEVIQGYEFYFAGGINPKNFMLKLVSTENYQEFMDSPFDQAYLISTDADELRAIFSEDDEEFVNERQQLFSNVKFSFDNSWVNSVGFRKNLREITF